jgi:dihydropteroate synthase
MPSAIATTPSATRNAGPWNLPLPRGRSLPLTAGRPRVMGVLNLTPDSFSDGGRWTSAGPAVEHALSMLEAGASLVDLGAESTRPGGGVYGAGASDVPAEEELHRLLPVLERLRAETDAPLSVDTRKAEVARRALSAGADLVNDVSALGDPGMAEVVAEAGCPVVLMHSRGEISTMQREIRFGDLLAEVKGELAAAVARAEAAGIARDRIVIDPGIGFGKTAEQNLALVGSLPHLAELGLPILLGASRKSFLGAVDGAPPGERLPGSLAAAARGADGGAAIVRVHDVAETAAFLAVLGAIDRESRRAATP